MSLAAFNNLMSIASAGPLNAAYAVCRNAILPRTTAILPRVHALQSYYRRETGRQLDTETAVRVLDRLQAAHDDVPHPAAFAPVADYLIREGYTSEAIHAVIGYMARHGTAVGLGAWLAPEHRGAVEALMPEREPKRGQWGRDEDEDEDGEGE